MAFAHSAATSAAADAQRKSLGLLVSQVAAACKAAAGGCHWVVGFTWGSKPVKRLHHMPTMQGCIDKDVPFVDLV